MFDFYRLACAVPTVNVGDVDANLNSILAKLEEADKRGADFVVFPELALTGYTCGDLFFQQSLLDAAADALCKLVRYSQKLSFAFAVGVPLRLDGQLYNCAAVICGGQLRGVVPKTFIPNYNEFYEKRWFSSDEDLSRNTVYAYELGLHALGDEDVSICGSQIFDTETGVRVGVELCEDLWTPLPPSTLLALGGAEVIVNLSASNEVIAKRAYRKQLVCQQSARCMCAYAYASAGATESTSDLIFSGHSLIAENGALLCETEGEIVDEALIVCDVDIGRVKADRMKNKCFGDSMRLCGQPCDHTPMPQKRVRGDGSLYALKKLPFVPSEKKHRLERCNTIFAMQVAGLKKRLKITGTRPVIGISGGLDSTLALLVCVKAAQELGRPMSDVVGITMPCFGTSDRTHDNAVKLMQKLGVTSVEISIAEACKQHFADIGHDASLHDGTYENSQARERTQVLMDYASRVGGLVVGTGDLSELALGWCTYNGDHMSMYGVNGSVPKTLVRWMIDSVVNGHEFPDCDEVLTDILDTPISPELLPPDEKGQIAQETESIVGPYALHDFFLYYLIRYGFEPKKIFYLAKRTFEGDFDGETILKWLKTFYKRFFTQQFKRDCMPDGVKVGSISLSPRGDWRMPSDASSSLWLKQLDEIKA